MILLIFVADIKCSDYHTCELCHEDPACGWCDQGDGTGLGTCMGGSNAGPLNVSAAGSELDFEQCPASDWYFTECPCKLQNNITSRLTTESAV